MKLSRKVKDVMKKVKLIGNKSLPFCRDESDKVSKMAREINNLAHEIHRELNRLEHNLRHEEQHTGDPNEIKVNFL